MLGWGMGRVGVLSREEPVVLEGAWSREADGRGLGSKLRNLERH
jgi:hypothetical protein